MVGEFTPGGAVWSKEGLKRGKSRLQKCSSRECEGWAWV